MGIRVHYQYKEYPFAPKASRKSRSFAILTTWPMLAFVGIFWMYIMDYILSFFIASPDICIVAAFITLIPYIILVQKFKKHMIAKIDAQAAEEAKRNMQNQEVSK